MLQPVFCVKNDQKQDNRVLHPFQEISWTFDGGHDPTYNVHLLRHLLVKLSGLELYELSVCCHSKDLIRNLHDSYH